MSQDETAERLAARAAAGDRAAFAQLVDTHGAGVRRLVRLHGVAPADCDDVVQRAFLKVWRALADYDPARSFQAWLFGVAVNAARDWRRYRRVRALLFGAAPFDESEHGHEGLSDPTGSPVERAVDAQQTVARLQRALAALPTALKEPLLLTAIGGLSYAEAADALGIGAKTLEGRIARARAKLAAALGDR